MSRVIVVPSSLHLPLHKAFLSLVPLGEVGQPNAWTMAEATVLTSALPLLTDVIIVSQNLRSPI